MKLYNISEDAYVEKLFKYMASCIGEFGPNKKSYNLINEYMNTIMIDVCIDEFTKIGFRMSDSAFKYEPQSIITKITEYSSLLETSLWDKTGTSVYDRFANTCRLYCKHKTGMESIPEYTQMEVFLNHTIQMIIKKLNYNLIACDMDRFTLIDFDDFDITTEPSANTCSNILVNNYLTNTFKMKTIPDIESADDYIKMVKDFRALVMTSDIPAIRRNRYELFTHGQLNLVKMSIKRKQLAQSGYSRRITEYLVCHQ